MSITPMIKLIFILLFLVSCSEKNSSTDNNETNNVKQATEFSLIDLKGRSRSITEWEGKVIVINFWATWCLPCRREMPIFMDLNKLYAAKGLQFIGIAIDQKPAVVKYINEIGLTYPILISSNEVDKSIKISQQYGNKYGSLPYTVIIDRKGIIRHKISGELKQQQIVKLLLPLL